MLIYPSQPELGMFAAYCFNGGIIMQTILVRRQIDLAREQNSGFT